MTEEYRLYKKDVEVSDMGNVKKGGELMEIHHGTKYDFVCFDGFQHRIHVMVAECFQDICGKKEPWYHVHHINKNQRDNRAVNLMYVSPSEHKRLHQKESGVSVPVKAYDLKGNYVGRWDSIEQAAVATKSIREHISHIINGGGKRQTTNGLVWFIDGTPEEEVKAAFVPILERYQKKELKKQLAEEKRKRKQEKAERVMEERQRKLDLKKVVEFNIAGEEMKVWNNAEECAEFYHITSSRIKRNIKGESVSLRVFDGENYKKIYFKPFIRTTDEKFL